MVCPSRSDNFNNFKGCLPQILLSPFSNTLTPMYNAINPYDTNTNMGV